MPFPKRCWLEFRFQNLPFSKFAGKNVPFSCEREAYPSHFSPFSKCTGIMCTQSKMESESNDIFIHFEQFSNVYKMS